MAVRELVKQGQPALDQVLGYLNFSSGAPDPQFLASLNTLFVILADHSEPAVPAYQQLGQLFLLRLPELKSQSPAFSDTSQAESIAALLVDHVIPGYLAFHHDLLFHQSGDRLFNALMVGRTCEMILAQGGPWSETERITEGAIRQLNDYLGHRPVAALENRKMEPYPHEWVRPVPLFVRDAGVVHGSYHEVVTRALQLLENTDADLLRSAYFDPALLDELAYDPRSYDFDHPVNKRPNYHFGQWDPHCIDNKGFYRRFVVQQVTLDALMDRINEADGLPLEEIMFEAAAVLAGTILMASGVSGNGPAAHDSTVTLATLMPHIAAYRDEFYERLIARAEGQHASRLRDEAKEKRQPFGGARQHLNAFLARRRASQMEHVHLARLFARMGHLESAQRETQVVPVASARIVCQIDCLLTAGHTWLEKGSVQQAAELAPQMVDLLHRGIQCGALIDPWNILGFDAHFSLFPALENSVHDHRADELVSLMDRIFDFCSRTWSEAAALDAPAVCEAMDTQFRELAQWWRQFAVHEVDSVEASDVQETYQSAQHVAKALNLWHRGGGSAGDVAFWAPHAEMFSSPQAYALVVEALLLRGDFVAAMALLMHWLGQADRVALEQSECSFNELIEQWLLALLAGTDNLDNSTWTSVRKFFDYLEANAEDYWKVPGFELGRDATGRGADGDDDLEVEMVEDDEEEDLFGAAYEDMVYHDSTNDGTEGSIFESHPDDTHDEFIFEARRISDRLAFLNGLARAWKLAAVSVGRVQLSADESAASIAALRSWTRQAARHRTHLLALLESVRNYKVALPSNDYESMVRYDRQRVYKDSLLEEVISTIVETADAEQFMLASCPDEESSPAAELPLEEDERLAVKVLAAMLHRDRGTLKKVWPGLIDSLSKQPLLYVPIAKGGNPRQIVRARVRQRRIQDLLAWLPRTGLLKETCQLIDTAREMERDHPVGAGAVTEFDELFKIGYKAIVDSLVRSAETWDEAALAEEESDSVETVLVGVLEQLTEALLVSWLNHSRTLRLSVLEKVRAPAAWKGLTTFIRRFGQDLFTQQFLSLGNVRAILHQGVGDWLQALQEAPEGSPNVQLLDELDRGVDRAEAIEYLTIVLEAIVENYNEYRDYNSTTTQSDRGDMLYTLLDFLRLRSDYDRICWKLKPVVLAHEILVRRGHEEAAKMWRRAVAERTGKEADKFLDKLKKLQKKHAMRMPTVSDRLAERFIRPLSIDRMRALVGPAVQESRGDGPCPVFELLEHETQSLTREPSGAGLEIPVWLQALDEEVHRACRSEQRRDYEEALDQAIVPCTLSLECAREQLPEADPDDVL